MKRKPRVSILMPTYNDAQYLSAAIESMLDQTFTDFEFIIVDDRSADETPEILSWYARKDKRIRTLRNRKNLGRAGARNQALKAKPLGEYIAVMDSDDVSLPERLEKQVAFLDANPDIVAVGAQVVNVDEQGIPTPEQTHLPETHGSLAWTLVYSVPFCNPVTTMRADAVNKIGLYQTGSAVEDAEYWTRMAYVGRFANLSEALLLYRMPSARLMRRMADWYAPLCEVSHLFVENLIGESLVPNMSQYLRHTLFYDPDLHLATAEVLEIMCLTQKILDAMQAKHLLEARDIEEVSALILNQVRVLLSCKKD